MTIQDVRREFYIKATLSIIKIIIALSVMVISFLTLILAIYAGIFPPREFSTFDSFLLMFFLSLSVSLFIGCLKYSRKAISIYKANKVKNYYQKMIEVFLYSHKEKRVTFTDLKIQTNLEENILKSNLDDLVGQKRIYCENIDDKIFYTLTIS